MQKLLEKAIDLREKAQPRKYDTLLKQAQDYIEAHYHEYDISLNSVAASVNLSPNHFSAIFSQELGETFIEYLTKIRMEKAKELLSTTDGPVADLAYQLGWASSNYFCTVFKKYTGVTPLQYRKQSRE